MSFIEDWFEEQLNKFFNNSGGPKDPNGKPIPIYGGTGTGAEITGNVTGGSGTGSSYPIVMHPSDQSIDTQTAPGTQDYSDNNEGGVDAGAEDEHGNDIYIDIKIYAPVTMPGDLSSMQRELLRLKYNLDMVLYGKSNIWPYSFLVESRGEHFSDGHIHPGDNVIYAGGVGGNAIEPVGEVSSFTVRMNLGSSSNDTTYGASGSDFLLGGDGNDIIYGYGGNDTIQGGAGADTMDGGDDIDTLDYSYAPASIYIDLRTNTALYGDAAGDVISNFENVNGGSGNDTIYGSDDANVLNGYDGDDIIAGAGGDDTLWGGGGNGNDWLEGGNGNDWIGGGAGADILNGGDGIDTLIYSPTIAHSEVGVYIDVRTNTALYGDAEGNRISNFENVIGGWGNDTIYGSDDANVLDGSVGNDILAGAGGHDTLEGSHGSDMLYGGDGNDVIAGGYGYDFIQGGTGADTLDGGVDIGTSDYSNDTLDYSNDNAGVYIDVRTNSAFHGEAEGDVISNFENVNGGFGHDTIYGSDDANELRGQNGHDILAGAGGNDTLYGDTGNDWLEGGNGDDFIFGGNDADRLVGGAGNDVLVGGEGRDTFVFDTALNAASNVDQLVGFSTSEDTIALSRSIFGGFGSSVWVAVGQGAGPGPAQIVYDDTTGELFYDVDGEGGTAQVQFAHLATGLMLTSGNFVLL